MTRRMACALGTLALSWLGGLVSAANPPAAETPRHPYHVEPANRSGTSVLVRPAAGAQPYVVTTPPTPAAPVANGRREPAGAAAPVLPPVLPPTLPPAKPVEIVSIVTADVAGQAAAADGGLIIVGQAKTMGALRPEAWGKSEHAIVTGDGVMKGEGEGIIQAGFLKKRDACDTGCDTKPTPSKKHETCDPCESKPGLSLFKKKDACDASDSKASHGLFKKKDSCDPCGELKLAHPRAKEEPCEKPCGSKFSLFKKRGACDPCAEPQPAPNAKEEPCEKPCGSKFSLFKKKEPVCKEAVVEQPKQEVVIVEKCKEEKTHWLFKKKDVCKDECKKDCPDRPMLFPKKHDEAPATDDCDHCTDNSTDYHVIVGGGAYFVKPHWNTNPAFSTLQILGLVGRSTELDFDYDFAPLAWVRWVNGDCLGIRARWWMFDQSAEPATITNVTGVPFIAFTAAPLGVGLASGTAGDVLTVNADLRVQVYDLEATQDTSWDAWSILWSAGLRYAYVAQDYNATLDQVAAGADDILASGHSFRGIGPTVSIEARRELGNGLSLYGNGRGALLFGQGRYRSQVLINLIAPGGDGAATIQQVVPVLEAEVGVGYGRDVGRARWFVQTAVVGQAWFGAGNAANTNLLVGTTGTDELIDNDATLGFFGLKIETGILY